MDKSWMRLANTTNGRLTTEYADGVKAFLKSAEGVIDIEGLIRCPCKKCKNVNRLNGLEVFGHLMVDGITQTYTVWNYHGETRASTVGVEVQGNEMGGIDAMVEDRIRAENIMHDGASEPAESEHNESVLKFDKLLSDAQREVYPGSEFSLLRFVITVMNMKVVNNWSNKSLNMLLEFLKKLVPKENIVPNSMYEVKKILRELGMGYECIHACKNDCSLFWKDNATLDTCPVCKESRYKYSHGNGKKIPHKVLRWLPLIPRLQRLFMSRKIAQQMKWHSKRKDKNDGLLKHPSDGSEWQEFDTKHPEFAMEPRNVRLGLATDGFNPFGHMSTAYSMWPVIVMPYNLPPWMGMKESFFMMPLLIPGPHAPGKEIDVYLRPLVNELKELWQNGVLTYDASTGQTFRLRAALMSTINDFPAYGDISGWTTKGYYACPNCNDNPLSVGLKGKLGFFGHRSYLPENHPWRTDVACTSGHFNGKAELNVRTLELPGEKVLDQLGRIPQITLGKLSGSKRPREDRANKLSWAKVSIFYELPYWGKKKLRHNIDVMHVEKNICENLCGTLLGLDKKNKDTNMARLDLEEMGIREELHLKQRDDRTFEKPHSGFMLTQSEREGFYKFLKSVKYPDGYAGNISRSVSTKDGKMTGLKSHDYHVLLQRILPIGMRGYVSKEIGATLFELGHFFENMCSQTLLTSDLEKMEEGIVRIMCKLEKIFPPAFFDVMVHLAVHLPREAILGGPVHYRWMYPIERVRNDLPSLHYLRWTHIPEAERAPIEASLRANFNLIGTTKAIKQTLNKTLGKKTRDFTCSLHQHWKKLVDDIGMVHARSNPPAKCDQGRWVKLIDHKWTNERWKRISAINKANRAKSKTNHGCGSKSLPIRVHEMIEQSQNGEIAFPPLFKETNYNEKTKKWASDNREGQYLEMLRIEEELASKKLPPLTAEEMSRKVLRPRSGIVKGLGMRPSSSFQMTSTSASQGSSEEVVRLQRELEEQRLQMDAKLDQQRQGLEEQLEQQRQENARTRAELDSVMEFVRSFGYNNGPRPPPGDGSSGLGFGVLT